MLNKSILKQVKEILETANVCNRCILRFFGVKEYTSYISKTDIEKSIKLLVDEQSDDLDKTQISQEDSTNDCPSAKRFSPNPCSSCLGILQGACDEMPSKLDDAVVKSQHKFKDFILQVSLPVVVDLRDRLFLLYLEEKLGDSYSFDEEEIPSVKDICKWVIGSQYGKLTNSDFTPDSDFQILISSVYSETIKECAVLFKNCPGAFPNARKRKVKEEEIYTKAAVLHAMKALYTEMKKLYSLPPSPPDKCCTFDAIKCTHSPLYLGGRYNKYSRELSQTPWILDGKRIMNSSVNELITDIVQKRIIADKIIFSASGREDVDVKMLGNGRPFVLELLNPRCLEWSDETIKAIEDEINKNSDIIAVRDLQVISKMDTLLLKEGEEKKRKNYVALCLVKKILSPEDVEKLQSLKELKLEQKTPIRVLHRRTLATRERLIHSMEAKLVSDHLLQLKIETQAGTYVKEFVHGDFGRTTPNLGTLLNTTADILELDVENIHLEWPPKPNSDKNNKES
ncbi:tRNA pseudouridine synthase Pus10 [Trichonephila clavata]|uniref:tRNA pseudouridine(55) synthase n=1 Tax=Trichonephila clavata TaxID=2740835 RepID=A0A8X6LBL5_TRICU|nr:tRNA pseudouridine synthase Pus10 [Trichonephila clavata]